MAVFSFPSMGTIRRTLSGRRGMGYRRDRPDVDDYPIDQLLGDYATSTPDSRGSILLAGATIPPKDQGPTESCTGQGTVQILRETLLFAGYPCPDLSALDNYFDSRAYEGLSNADVGAYPRNNVRALREFGVATEKAWPFSITRVNMRPSWAASRSGHDLHRLDGYYRIPAGDTYGIRRAISIGAGVIGGFPVDQAFGRDDGPEVIEAPRGEIAGWHLVGIDEFFADGTFGILNSYGSRWRRFGRARITDEYASKGVDVWALHVTRFS